MGIVVYNPTDTPRRTEAGVVDGRGWLYVKDPRDVENDIGDGRLVVADVPESLEGVNRNAVDAFQNLKNEKGEKKSRRSKQAPSQVGDTEVSENKDSKTEKEA